MFPCSTQAKYWMFSSEDELTALREKTNAEHVRKYGRNIPDNKKYEYFLTPEEECIMVRRFEFHLRDFCRHFQPPMPKYVVGTAFHYFKRFYIYNSVMNYHPKEVMVTCIYLASKVEEFHVSIEQFVANIKGDRSKATDIILNNELLLMEQLKFHLTIHNPFRPVEGLLIDIKTRSTLNDPERLRPGIDDLFDSIFLTDGILLYSPSQIALAAVLHAASKLQENLDSYVTDTLFGEEGQDNLKTLIEAVKGIRSMVKVTDVLPEKNQLKLLDKKLERCRNPENNPDSEIYKQRMLAMLNDEDEVYHQIMSASADAEKTALNMQSI